MANYALENEILLGSLTAPDYKWTNDRIVLNSLRGVYTVDVLCNELSIDEFTFTIRYNSVSLMVYKPTDAPYYRGTDGGIYAHRTHGTPERLYLTDVAYGAPVWHFVGGSFFVRGYIKDIKRIEKRAWQVTCQSAVGLIDAQTSVGGMYTGEEFALVLAGIVHGYVVPPDPEVPGSETLVVGDDVSFQIATEISWIGVYGRLPYSTRRKNLHTLLFATGAVLTRASEEIDYRICYPSLEEHAVPTSRIALGGSVTVQEASNQAEITEHSFIALSSDTEETLFDNTSSAVADHELIVFRDPMHDLVASGVTVHEANCNYAIVSGSGTLTGKRYTHVTRIVTASSAEEGDIIRAKHVTDNELVSPANSLNTARRVLSYYSSARTLKSKMQLQGERPGMLLALSDAFGGPTTAYLRKANVLVTSVKGADCELVEGYVPAWGGNNYTQRAFISASGTWTVPGSGEKQIRLILFQAGSGGQGGYDGERGYGRLPVLEDYPDGTFREVENEAEDSLGFYMQGSPVPQGGSAGEPGLSGKIFIIDLLVQGGDTVDWSIGAGGTGGARNGGAGAVGGETTATVNGVTYSSADGSRSAEGFVDSLGGAVFARPGELGHRGGNGGQSSATGANGGNSEGLYNQNAGQGGKGLLFDAWGVEGLRASGGGAGGSAYGADGINGGDAVWDDEHLILTTGSGGDGADAVAPAQPTYGSGGGGGNGGGAGGNVAGGKVYGVTYPGIQLILGFKGPTEPTAPRHGGAPGLGSAGGKGGDGGGLVYY